MLTDRLAAFITGHDPGWRLPLSSALARRFEVTIVSIECALRELVERRLVRQLPDGRLYRAGPADYLIALEGLPDIGAVIDPLGATVRCTERLVSWRRIPETIAVVLGLPPAAEGSVVRCQWSVNGHRAALSTTYLSNELEPQVQAAPRGAIPLDDILVRTPASVIGTIQETRPFPASAHIEFQPPTLAVARSLDLAPGDPAITVTVRFHASAHSVPVAVTVVVLRADLFRIILEASADGLAAPAASLTDHLAESGP